MHKMWEVQYYLLFRTIRPRITFGSHKIVGYKINTTVYVHWGNEETKNDDPMIKWNVKIWQLFDCIFQIGSPDPAILTLQRIDIISVFLCMHDIFLFFILAVQIVILAYVIQFK